MVVAFLMLCFELRIKSCAACPPSFLFSSNEPWCDVLTSSICLYYYMYKAYPWLSLCVVEAQHVGPERGDAEALPSTKFGLIRLSYQPPILRLFPQHEKMAAMKGLDKISNDKMFPSSNTIELFLGREFSRRRWRFLCTVLSQMILITPQGSPTMQTFQVAELLSSGGGCWTLHVLTVCSVRWRGESRRRGRAWLGSFEGQCGDVRELWHRWC